jgi:lipopolysaccharide assembly outer membrane protein LptD (OstA)
LKNLYWPLIIFFFFILGKGAIAAEPLKLIRANTLNQQTSGSQRWLFLEGDVRFAKGNIRLNCEKAYHYEKENKLLLRENVTITDEETLIRTQEIDYLTDTDFLKAPGPTTILYKKRTLTANRLYADLDTKRYTAVGNVTLIDSVNQITADSVIYDDNLETAWLFGNASVIDTTAKSGFLGDKIYLHLNEKFLNDTQNARFVQYDSLGATILTVWGDTLDAYSDSGLFIAKWNVSIEKDSLRAVSDSLYYFTKDNIASLYGKPRIEMETHHLSGKKINLHLKEGRAQRMEALDDALMTTQMKGYTENDTVRLLLDKTSRLSGNKLDIFFTKENKLDFLEMKGMAASDYYVFEDSLYQGQNIASGDTVQMQFQNDSLLFIRISGGAEGKFIPQKETVDMDTTLLYYGETIHYQIPRQITRLSQSARLIYGDMNLDADTIRVEWGKNILTALPQITDTGYVNLPKMEQKGDDPIYGEELVYNMQTRKGRIRNAKTNVEDGIYYGEKILNRENTAFYVEYGRYTTCDEAEPHYWIEARQMKLIPNDKVFAKPLILKIDYVPLFYLPFGFFPTKKGGRQSGWLMPGYGSGAVSGRFLKGGGYYWAPNDYFDTKVTLDFYDKQGILLRNSTRYALRYHLTGNISGSYNNNFLTDSKQRSFDIKIIHNQNIGAKSRLAVNGSYTNNRNYYQSMGTSLEERLTQQLLSTATYTTRMGPFGVSANLSRTEDLVSGNVKATVPQISLSKNAAALFKKPAAGDKQNWYHKITYNVNSRFTNNYTSTLQNDSTFLSDTKNHLQHNGSLRFSDKFFGWLSLSPSLNWKEDWIMKYKSPYLENGIAATDSSGKMILEDIETFKRRGTYSASFSSSTKLYGIFPVNIGPLSAFRHVLSPSLSYSYQPDFSKNHHYVFDGVDDLGKTLRYDYFSGTLAGSTPSSESQSVSFSLGNQFTAKVLQKDGSSRKYDFLTMNLSSAYNFKADSLKLSPFRLSYRASQLPAGLAFSGNAGFDPYVYDLEKRKRIDQFYDIPRLTNFSFDTGFNFKEDKSDTSSTTAGISKWSGSLNLRYNYSASVPDKEVKTITAAASFSAQITPAWKLSYRANFDIFEGKLTYHSFSLYRDMHCWELKFDWTPGGMGQGYFFLVRIKSPSLRDIKVEKKGGRFKLPGF